jgi:hypothetical protein
VTRIPARSITSCLTSRGIWARGAPISGGLRARAKPNKSHSTTCCGQELSTVVDKSVLACSEAALCDIPGRDRRHPTGFNPYRAGFETCRRASLSAYIRGCESASPKKLCGDSHRQDAGKLRKEMQDGQRWRGALPKGGTGID